MKKNKAKRIDKVIMATFLITPLYLGLEMLENSKTKYFSFKSTIKKTKALKKMLHSKAKMCTIRTIAFRRLQNGRNLENIVFYTHGCG